MSDSIPPSDREWMAQLLQKELQKVHDRFDSVDERLDRIEERQDDSERREHQLTRQTSAADLDQQREIAELWRRLSEDSGRRAGRESGAAAGKKWAAVSAAIALVSTLVNALLAREIPPVTIPPRAPVEQSVPMTPME